ncbi:MAG TPA: hypothetical protein VK601_08935, partial [Kofleriaceae bacterium]|nr:hypothetical protein [Kofleriaceae bacterium]
LDSSEAKQQIFLLTMFGIWDAYYPRIHTMVVNWEVDLPELFAEVVANGAWSGASCQPTGSVPATPTAPTLAPHGAAGTATWQYYLLAGNATGSSAPGAIATITSGPSALSPTSFVHLTWAPVAGATQYKVMRLTSGGQPAQTGAIATTSATAFDDTGLAVAAFNLQEFLRTLGYRTYTTPVGDKLGFLQLASEAHARGW